MLRRRPSATCTTRAEPALHNMEGGAWRAEPEWRGLNGRYERWAFFLSIFPCWNRPVTPRHACEPPATSSLRCLTRSLGWSIPPASATTGARP
eukprot:scaffold1354_cov111-Isochrysis_galbana.AAC.13